jgi:predicted PurR-regulated permease PerM
MVILYIMQVKVPPHTFLRNLQYVFFISVILYFGKPLFIPLSFGVLISCLLYPLCAWLERHKVSRMGAIVISLMGTSVLLGLILFLLVNQLMRFVDEWPELQSKLMESFTEISLWITAKFEISKDQQWVWLNKSINDSGGSTLSFLQSLISTTAVGSVLLILMPIYTVLILFYRNKWLEVLYRLFPTQGRERIRDILKLSIESYYSFMKGMLLVYFIVGILNSVGLYLLGIPHAFLFGFIASVLTFIPYVGILIASLLPISMAWITYNSIWYPLGVIAIFTLVQYLEANLIFPLAVSRRLKINALATILVIFAGGILWGVAGMILFVPFLGILKLIADKTPGLKTLSLILGGGEKG